MFTFECACVYIYGSGGVNPLLSPFPLLQEGEEGDDNRKRIFVAVIFFSSTHFLSPSPSSSLLLRLFRPPSRPFLFPPPPFFLRFFPLSTPHAASLNMLSSKARENSGQARILWLTSTRIRTRRCIHTCVAPTEYTCGTCATLRCAHKAQKHRTYTRRTPNICIYTSKLTRKHTHTTGSWSRWATARCAATRYLARTRTTSTSRCNGSSNTAPPPSLRPQWREITHS